MHPTSVERRTIVHPVGTVTLRTGDRMDQKTFHSLYLRTEEGFRAQLIGGTVYVASPTLARHGRPHARMSYWLSTYAEATDGTTVCDATTTILGDESEPEPDVALFVDPECGGQVVIDDAGFLVGSPELLVEVSYSSVSIDLHAKKRDYEAADVREYIVVRVESQTVDWFRRGRRGFSELAPDSDGVLRSRTFPGLWLDPEAVFDKSLRRPTAVLRQGIATPEHAAFVARLEAKARRRKPNPREGRE